MIAFLLQILVLVGCILLAVKPDISGYKPKAWWTKRRLITYRILFSVFAVVLIIQLVQGIAAKLA